MHVIGLGPEGRPYRSPFHPSEPFRSRTYKYGLASIASVREHMLGTSARPQRAALFDADPLFWDVPNPDDATAVDKPSEGRYLVSITTPHVSVLLQALLRKIIAFSIALATRPFGCDRPATGQWRGLAPPI